MTPRLRLPERSLNNTMVVSVSTCTWDRCPATQRIALKTNKSRRRRLTGEKEKKEQKQIPGSLPCLPSWRRPARLSVYGASPPLRCWRSEGPTSESACCWCWLGSARSVPPCSVGSLQKHHTRPGKVSGISQKQRRKTYYIDLRPSGTPWGGGDPVRLTGL